MAKENIVTIDNIARGMTPDIRQKLAGFCKVSQHFDILTRPNTITPYRSMVDGDSSPTIQQLSDFLWTDSGTIFGAGLPNSIGNAYIVYKAPTDLSWNANANNSSSGKTPVPGVFVEYHSKFYGSNTDGTIWKADKAGGVAWVNNDATASFACTTNGLVHSKDDILYMGGGNLIYANNNGSWNTTALTLPNKYVVTSLSEYGNYLAIACRNAINPYGNSVVYLWDRDTTLNTVSEVLDFGIGQLLVLEQVEGVLIGISLRGDIVTGVADRIVFRKYDGNTPDVFLELLPSTTSGVSLLNRKSKVNQKLYFLADIIIDGVLRNGIWGIGKNAEGLWVVWQDRLPNNDTAVTIGTLKGFISTGDYVLISYSDSGWKTKQTSTTMTDYTASSVIETVINPNMQVNDYWNMKQLVAIAPSYSPISSGGQVILKYKVDGGSWITILTETTVGAVVTERNRITDGTAFTKGLEYQFRVESSGGVMVTGMRYSYDVLDSLIN